jgi:autotransporter-associated beta strand protein
VAETLTLATADQTISSLTYNSGTYNDAGFALNLSSTATALTMQGVAISGQINLTGLSGGNILFTSGTPSLQNLGLGGVTRDIDVATGVVATVFGDITNGGITVTGTGTLNLASPNAYAGDTTVTSGTLAVMGSIANSTSITVSGGTLRNFANSQMNSSATVAVSSGTWDLNGFNQDVSTLTLSGGSVTTGAGVLSLASTVTPLTVTDSQNQTGTINFTGASGDLSFGSGAPNLENLDLGGVIRVFDVAAGGTATISGVISDGGVTKTGPGTLVFFGPLSNTYTSLTTVTAGILQLNKPPILAEAMLGTSISGDVLINGGSLLNITANQFAPGATVTITSGTWDLGLQAQTLTSLTFEGGSIVNNATLNLEGTGTALTMRNMTLTGNINLTGSAPSTVLFDATNNGTAQINTVHLGSFDRTFNIQDGTATNDLILVSGTSSGGGLIKAGPGTLLIPALSSITGGSNQVTGGTLHVDGTFSGTHLTTDAGTMLVGSGTINSPSTINGILQPGANIGVITFVGNQIFGTTSVLEIELNPTQIDLVTIITGSLTINPGATLSFMPQPTVYPPDLEMTLIQTSDGVFGTFTNVINSFPAYDVQFFYTPLAVKLGVGIVPFSTLVSSGNSGQVGQYLDAQTPTQESDLAFVVGSIRMETTIDGIKNDLNLLHPAPLKGLSISAENSAIQARSTFTNRMNQWKFGKCLNYKSCNHFSYWGDVQGDFFHQGRLGGNIGFNNQSVIATIGVDYSLCKKAIIGAAATYNKSYLQWEHEQDEGTIGSAYGSLYGSWSNNFLAVNGTIMGGGNHYEEKRKIQLQTINRQAHADFNGWQGLAHLDIVGYLKQQNSYQGLIIGADYTYLQQNGFKEKGADSINLQVQPTDYRLLRTQAGIQLSFCGDYYKGDWWFQPHVSYIRQDRFGGSEYKSKMEGAVGYFTVTGIQPTRQLVAGGINMTYHPKKRDVTFSVEYGFEVGKKYWDQNIQLRIMF